MKCRGCGTEMGAVGISDAINDAVDEVLQASIRDAEKHGGVARYVGIRNLPHSGVRRAYG